MGVAIGRESLAPHGRRTVVVYDFKGPAHLPMEVSGVRGFKYELVITISRRALLSENSSGLPTLFISTILSSFAREDCSRD